MELFNKRNLIVTVSLLDANKLTTSWKVAVNCLIPYLHIIYSLRVSGPLPSPKWIESSQSEIGGLSTEKVEESDTRIVKRRQYNNSTGEGILCDWDDELRILIGLRERTRWKCVRILVEKIRKISQLSFLS